MKRYVKAEMSEPILESRFFDLVQESGIGVNNTPWTGLRVISKDLAKKHVVEVRLKYKGYYPFDGEPVNYKYTDAEVVQGMRMESNTLEETQEVIDVLQDAVDFALEVNEYLAENN